MIEIVDNKSKEEIEKAISNKSIVTHIKSQGIEKNDNYFSYLYVLYKGGTVDIGWKLPTYNNFLNEITAAGIKFKEQEVKDFVTICNLFKITDMSGPDRKIAKSYFVAKEILTLLAKE